MRLPRFVIALSLLATPVATVAVTATSASAAPLTYTSVSVATRGACAVATDGNVVCWGDNPDRWVMPDRPAGAVPTPTKISLPNGLKWKSVSAGEGYTNCGIAENDRAYCWGNHHIGSYFTTTSRTPVEVELPADVRVTDVQGGYSTACATSTTSELWCWGDAHYLGDGSIDPVRIPVRIAMPDNNPIRRFNVGLGGVCAVTSVHNMYCWGSNGDGQLGLGYAQQYPYSFSWTPVLIPTPAGEQWDMPSNTSGRICALTVSGAGYCAGDNYNGSFGNGTYDDSTRFTKMVVPNNERLITIATGWYHTCVGTESGKMWCFGRGDYGELGTGTTLGGRTWRTPVVPDGVTFVSFDAGVAGTCALDSTGRVWCWGGLNWGSQGTGRVNAGLFPELIAPVGSPSVVATGATDIDAEVATITGAVNPNGYASTVIAEISLSQSFATTTRYNIAGSFPNDSYLPTTFSLPLTSLAPRTTHYVRLVATNTFGTVTGNVTSFTTLGEEPAVGDVTSQDLTGNEATISATLHPNRLATTAYFEYSTNSDFSTDSNRVDLESFRGNIPVQRSSSLSDLLPRTRYYVRAVATNRLGKTVGSTHTFLTVGDRPTVTLATVSATTTRIDITAQIVSGLVRGIAFAEVSTSPSFTSVIRSGQQSFTSRTNDVLSFSVHQLSSRTDYWVRVVAENAVGTTTSDARAQRTSGGVPVVRIGTISSEPRRATAPVFVDSTGLETFTKLQVSESADLSNATEYFVSSSSSDHEQRFDIALQDLTPGTTYYVVAHARNDAGRASTPTVTFVTPRPIGVVINDDDDTTESTTVSLLVTAPAGAVAYRVSNHSNFKNAQVFNPSSPIRWELIASDEPEDIRYVYVQVYFANGTSVVYSDDISLLTNVDVPDEEAPVIETLRASRVAATAQATAQKTSHSRIAISVRDRRSGVTRIEMKAGARTIVTKVDASRRGTFNISIPRGSKSVLVRVRDAAGNYSKWKKFRIN